jgi:peptide deformylase
MAELSLLEYPDYRLRVSADPVDSFDHDLGQLVDDLCETMDARGIVGLSAPQVDVRKQVAVIAPSDPEAPGVYINPRILARKGLGFVREQCESIPGIQGSVMRSMQVRVRAQDRDGNTFEQTLMGMDAVCIQHELDHLQGKLFIDRLFVLRRLMIGFGMVGKARQQIGQRERPAA